MKVGKVCELVLRGLTLNICSFQMLFVCFVCVATQSYTKVGGIS